MGKAVLLNSKQCQEVLAILTVGCNRVAAARYSGCTLAGISATAKKDADFAEKLRKAEGMSEIEAMKSIMSAARQERYWKAATWILERHNPDAYRARVSGAFTSVQLRRILDQLTEILVEVIPSERTRKNIIKRFSRITAEWKK